MQIRSHSGRAGGLEKFVPEAGDLWGWWQGHPLAEECLKSPVWLVDLSDDTQDLGNDADFRGFLVMFVENHRLLKAGVVGFRL